MTNPNSAHLFICVGEKSGDKLALDLIIPLKKQYPDMTISGVGGDAMQTAGIELISHYKTFAVMGYWDVLKSLPAILRLKNKIQQHLLHRKPDLFIGIDAPDINLRLAQFCTNHCIPTVHYVSPQVWVWKTHRLKKIANIINYMLLLFPFEKNIYQQHNIPHHYVGHVAARKQKIQKQEARQNLGLSSPCTVIAVLIGSRQSELFHHLPIMQQVIQKLSQPNRIFITACSCASIADAIQKALPDIKIADLDTVLAAADIGIIKSGTITLEAALYQLPMVTYFQTGWLNKQLLKFKKFSLPFFTLPNILSNRFIVPELLLDEATPTLIAREASKLLDDSAYRGEMQTQLQHISQLLQTADITPDQAIVKILSC